MEYLIKCPKCEITDLELNDVKNKKSEKSFHCMDCDLDFSVEYKYRELKNVIERYWKKAALTAIIFI